MSTLRQTNEDELIARLIGHVPVAPGIAGPGDDCAVVEHEPQCPQLQLLKTDAIVEGIHFLPDTPADEVGWKATARVVSDIAAMGGLPRHFLVTIGVNADTQIDWLDGLYRGIGSCLRSCGAQLSGGETTRVPDGSATVISIAATGTVERQHLTLRSGGRPSDVLMVTGTLGGSITGKHLQFTPRLKQARWLVSHHKPTAMMDLSDGLASDLPRLAAASCCGIRLDHDALPVTPGCSPQQALTDGEDYELLIAVSPHQVDSLLTDWRSTFGELPLTPIGTLCEPAMGESLHGGWDHFAR